MGMSLAPWKAAVGDDVLSRIQQMADELCRQSADIAAAEYRWLRLLGEFDAMDGWVQGGARSCAAWLSWACGLSPMAARERVRVARALPLLPKVCSSFAAGRISYSKVRAITRVVNEHNEELLVSYAECATAAQLEKVLRGYRRMSRADEAKEAAEQFERRWVRHWVDDNGCVRISACLPPDDGALFVGQMDRLAESGGEDRAAPAAPEGAHVPAETAEAGRGDAPVVSARWDASSPIEARRADALRMMAETCAAKGPAACVGGDRHLVMLHADAGELRSGRAVDGALSAPDDAAADPATAVGTQIEGVGHVPAETARRISCDATLTALLEDAQGRPLGVGRQSRTVPRWLRRALRRRDRGRCRFPGCTATRFVDAHHIVHWADDGPTDLDNLVLLCRFHHRLVHEVGYGITVNAPGDFTFTRPDGSAVSEMPPAVTGHGGAVQQANTARGLGIDALTAIPNWDGTPPDYSMAVGVLQDVSAGTAKAWFPSG